MLVVSFLAWWYGAGWLKLIAVLWQRVQAVVGFFSVTQLAGSLFAPFRQISAGQAMQGSLSMQLRAFGDRLFSRLMGAVVRSILIVCGLVLAFLTLCFAMVAVCVWPLLPAAPVIGASLTLLGYAP